MAGERDSREQLVGGGAGGRVALGQVRGEPRLIPRFVEPSLFQKCRRGTQVTLRIGRLQLDAVPERVGGEFVAIQSPGKRGQLAPHVGQLRLVAEDLLQASNRRGPFALAGEVDRLPIRLDDVAFVFRIGQAFARRRQWIQRRAAVPHRLQPLARVGGYCGGSVNRRSGQETLERPAQRVTGGGVLSGQVAALAGIVLQIVQLLPRRLDVAVAIAGERGELAPAEVIACV